MERLSHNLFAYYFTDELKFIPIINRIKRILPSFYMVFLKGFLKIKTVWTIKNHHEIRWNDLMSHANVTSLHKRPWSNGRMLRYEQPNPLWEAG